MTIPAFEPTPPQRGETVEETMRRLFDEIVEHYRLVVAELTGEDAEAAEVAYAKSRVRRALWDTAVNEVRVSREEGDAEPM